MKEAAVCGHTEVHGGKFEWTCVKPEGHRPITQHLMMAFPRGENTH